MKYRKYENSSWWQGNHYKEIFSPAYDIYNNEIQSTNITNFFIQQQLAIHCQVHLSFILLGIAMNQYFIPYLYPICREIQILSPWSHQKTVGFLITLGGIKINQFAKVWLILEAKFGGDP